jgi:hypothetical protein
MLKFLNWFLWLFKLKPSLLIEKPEFKSLDKMVKFKMFSQGNFGMAILFKAYQELGNQEMEISVNGYYESRYRPRNILVGCWSIGFLCFVIEQAIDYSNSNLRFERTIDARGVFYQIIGEYFHGELSNTPKQGSIVLFPTDSGGKPRLGVVSRVLTDNKGKIRKWWYISGNEGKLIPKVAERRGDKKKTEGFMDLSEVKW